jgi:hypothetical protein
MTKFKRLTQKHSPHSQQARNMELDDENWSGRKKQELDSEEERRNDKIRRAHKKERKAEDKRRRKKQKALMNEHESSDDTAKERGQTPEQKKGKKGKQLNEPTQKGEDEPRLQTSPEKASKK